MSAVAGGGRLDRVANIGRTLSVLGCRRIFICPLGGVGMGSPQFVGLRVVLSGVGQFYRSERRQHGLPETNGHVRDEPPKLHQLGSQK